MATEYEKIGLGVIDKLLHGEHLQVDMLKKIMGHVDEIHQKYKKEYDAVVTSIKIFSELMFLDFKDGYTTKDRWERNAEYDAKIMYRDARRNRVKSLSDGGSCVKLNYNEFIEPFNRSKKLIYAKDEKTGTHYVINKLMFVIF